jgi:diguanylate cyclase (GGDEF)-like protein
MSDSEGARARAAPRAHHVLVRFGLLSALLVGAIGLVLARGLQSIATDRNLQDARSEAQVLVEVGILPALRGDDLSDGIPPEKVKALDEILSSNGVTATVVRLKIWNRDHVVVYSNAHDLIGKAFPTSPELETALGGQVTSEIADVRHAENVEERKFGSLFEAYVPLRYTPDGPPAGAFEIYRPYGPVAAATARDARRLDLELGLGLLVLWAGLFKTVATTSKRLRRQVQVNLHQARHDELTGLPNRTAFDAAVAEAVATARRDGTRCAVLVADLDQFKDVNDTLGHPTGDKLLVEVGARFAEALGPTELVARLGGDEFAVLLTHVESDASATATAERLLLALRDPVAVDEITLVGSASIGLAVFPDHADNPQGLLQRADIAMYVAKARRVGVVAYAPELDHHSPDRLALVADLRGAITGHQLVVHYQPKINVASRRFVGVEALVRWAHPTRGLIPPDDFIPLAEQTGLMGDLTDEVVEQALSAVAGWRASGLVLSVAVNLSVRSLYDTSLPTRLVDALERHRLPASLLELEITESTVMDRPAKARDTLGHMTALGMSVAIDDYGIGHSSLAYLRQLPVSTLKIDKSFVLNVETNRGDAAIVDSTIKLAHSLGLSVVAEGVETEGALRVLEQLGCDLAQGYHIARPMPADMVAAWAAQHRALRAAT